MKRSTLMLIVAGIVAVGILATAIGVHAQAPGQPPGGAGPGAGTFMRAGMMSSPAIAVAGDCVYVVYMGTLFKFNADTLEEEAQVRLRPQGLPGMPGGAGGAPGAPAGGGQ